MTPAYIVSLTCNAAFGAFWRAICERRKDERRDVLLARISKTMSALGSSSLVSVRKWLDESYNRAAEIESIVAEEPVQVRLRGRSASKLAATSSTRSRAAPISVSRPDPRGPRGGAHVEGAGVSRSGSFMQVRRRCWWCDFDFGGDRLDLRDAAQNYRPALADGVVAGRSPTLPLYANCRPAILRRVSELIAGCRVVTSLRAAREATAAARVGGAASSEAAPPPSGPLVFRRLPLSLDDGTLFRLLPHLMCPGTMVTLRPAVIVAIISVVTGSAVLAPRARTFLASVWGKVGQTSGALPSVRVPTAYPAATVV